MKKLIVIILTAFIPVLLAAQNSPLSVLYDKYESKPGYHTFKIRPGLMSFVWEKNMETGPVKEMMRTIESIRILKSKSESTRCGRKILWRRMQKAASDDLSNEVVSVNAGDVSLRVYMINQTEEKMKEVTMAVKYDEGIILATILGKTNFSSLINHDNMESIIKMVEYFMEHEGKCMLEKK
jgi:hypothetical protein